jgi:hypothetical protein
VNILAAIRREERKLEKQVGKLHRQLVGLKAAAKVLGDSTSNELGKARKRVMSAAARAKMAAAAKRRWAKVKAGARKAGSSNHGRRAAAASQLRRGKTTRSYERSKL